MSKVLPKTKGQIKVGQVTYHLIRSDEISISVTLSFFSHWVQKLQGNHVFYHMLIMGVGPKIELT